MTPLREESIADTRVGEIVAHPVGWCQVRLSIGGFPPHSVALPSTAHLRNHPRDHRFRLRSLVWRSDPRYSSYALAAGQTADYALVVRTGQTRAAGGVAATHGAMLSPLASFRDSFGEVVQEAALVVTNGEATFRFRMTAPVTGGPLGLWAVGLAANGNGLGGDRATQITRDITVTGGVPAKPDAGTSRGSVHSCCPAGVADHASMNVSLSCVALGLLGACTSSDSNGQDRENVPAAPGTSDAGPSGGGDGAVDPAGGRDGLAASCFASCQSSAFSCPTRVRGRPVLVRSAQVELGGEGCSGAMKDPAGELTISLDCSAATVCVADAPDVAATTCAAATFSAFSFAYGTTICTRVAD